jgi:hypothetical protein
MPNNAALLATSERDSFGSAQTAHIEGFYVHHADAFAAAQRCLDPTQFVEYDMQGDPDVDHWPFGEDVVVHAVSKTRQVQYVAVKKVLLMKIEGRELLDC